MKHLMQGDIVFVTLALIVTIAVLIFAFMIMAALVTLLGSLAHDTGKTGMGSSCAYLQDCYAPAGDLAYWDHYGGVAVAVCLVAKGQVVCNVRSQRLARATD